eukprot:c32941_g1_i1 orf=206-712(+)
MKHPDVEYKHTHMQAELEANALTKFAETSTNHAIFGAKINSMGMRRDIVGAQNDALHIQDDGSRKPDDSTRVQNDTMRTQNDIMGEQKDIVDIENGVRGLLHNKENDITESIPTDMQNDSMVMPHDSIHMQNVGISMAGSHIEDEGAYPLDITKDGGNDDTFNFHSSE